MEEPETTAARIDRQLAEEAIEEQTLGGHGARYHKGGNCVQGDECPFAPRKLDIWLTKGVVLVDPLTGELMTFERWGSAGAHLRNQRTGAQRIVGQSDVTTWKYIPRPIEAGQVWRSKDGGGLVLILETRDEGVQMRGLKKNDTPFWLARTQVADSFVWTPALPS